MHGVCIATSAASTRSEPPSSPVARRRRRAHLTTSAPSFSSCGCSTGRLELRDRRHDREGHDGSRRGVVDDGALVRWFFLRVVSFRDDATTDRRTVLVDRSQRPAGQSNTPAVALSGFDEDPEVDEPVSTLIVAMQSPP